MLVPLKYSELCQVLGKHLATSIGSCKNNYHLLLSKKETKGYFIHIDDLFFLLLLTSLSRQLKVQFLIIHIIYVKSNFLLSTYLVKANGIVSFYFSHSLYQSSTDGFINR